MTIFRDFMKIFLLKPKFGDPSCEDDNLKKLSDDEKEWLEMPFILLKKWKQ